MAQEEKSKAVFHAGFNAVGGQERAELFGPEGGGGVMENVTESGDGCNFERLRTRGTFLRRQEGKGSREWDPFFRKIKNVSSGPSRWEEEGMSEDANM